MEYLNAELSRERVEQFRVLFLDNRNRLLADEAQQRGTVNHTPVYPREVAKRALELHATALILVHNHPSGDPTPSDGRHRNDPARSRRPPARCRSCCTTMSSSATDVGSASARKDCCDTSCLPLSRAEFDASRGRSPASVMRCMMRRWPA